MKRGNVDVIFLGKYNNSEILTGPEKVAKRIFDIRSTNNNSIFIEHFNLITRRRWIDRIFGKEVLIGSDKKIVLRLGLINLFFILLKSKAKIVHIITFERFAVIAVIIGFLKNYKIIYNVHGIIRHELKHFHNVSSFFYFRNYVCEKIIFNYSDRLLFLSENSIRLAKKNYKFKSDKIEIIPNGIDPVFHNPRADITRPGNEELKLVFTGNVNRREKGFNTVLNILNKIKVSFCLFVISNDKMEMNGDFMHKIIFHDFMAANRLAEFLREKDIFISFPLYEPFSIACVEAMAAGLIPVVSANVGMSQYIKNNHNGFIIKENDSVKLNQIVELLTNDIEKRIQMSHNASKIYNELSWEKVYGKYDDIYNRVTGKN